MLHITPDVQAQRVHSPVKASAWALLSSFAALVILLSASVLSASAHASVATAQACADSPVSFRGKVRAHVTLSMPRCDEDWQAQPVSLSFVYAQNINAWFFKKAAKVILKRNLSDSQWQDNAALFKTIEHAYEGIKAGDEYTIAFDTRTDEIVLSKNGATLLRTKDANAQLYFLIWFGDKPMDTQVKTALLQ